MDRSQLQCMIDSRHLPSNASIDTENVCLPPLSAERACQSNRVIFRELINVRQILDSLLPKNWTVGPKTITGACVLNELPETTEVVHGREVCNRKQTLLKLETLPNCHSTEALEYVVFIKVHTFAWRCHHA